MFTSVTPSPGIKSAAILEIFCEALSNTSALDENDVTIITIAIKYFFSWPSYAKNIIVWIFNNIMAY